jgi:hypothetical protein
VPGPTLTALALWRAGLCHGNHALGTQPDMEGAPPMHESFLVIKRGPAIRRWGPISLRLVSTKWLL